MKKLVYVIISALVTLVTLNCFSETKKIEERQAIFTIALSNTNDLNKLFADIGFKANKPNSFPCEATYSANTYESSNRLGEITYSYPQQESDDVQKELYEKMLESELLPYLKDGNKTGAMLKYSKIISQGSLSGMALRAYKDVSSPKEVVKVMYDKFLAEEIIEEKPLDIDTENKIREFTTIANSNLISKIEMEIKLFKIKMDNEKRNRIAFYKRNAKSKITKEQMAEKEAILEQEMIEKVNQKLEEITKKKDARLEEQVDEFILKMEQEKQK